MNELKDIDLSAWEVPEPPEDLADAVVARLGGTDITPAIPVEKRRNRALIIGGVAAAVVALSLGVWTLIGNTDRAAPTNGVVVAQFAQQLALNGVTADLDVGANVRWVRDARTVRVQQRTGSAAWRIADDQRLVINAGTSTVEANGKSSLRVEVKMNKVERVVGASAFVAAAIVTVIVYDGRVTVDSPKHERVVVAPGTTYTVEPPVEERTVGVAPAKEVTTCDEVSCVLSDYEGPCCARYKPTSCDAAGLKDKGMEAVNMGEHAKALALFDESLACKRDSNVVALAFMAACNAQDTTKARLYYGQLSPTQQSKYKVMCERNHVDVTCDAAALKDKGMENVNMGQHAAALAQFEASLRCKHDPAVVVLAGQAACNAHNAAKVKQYKATCTTCDADDLKDKGMEQINMGEHAKALGLFEQSLACKPDPYVTQLAFMEACNSRNASKARDYFGQLSKTEQTKYMVICERNKVDLVDTAGYLQVSSKPEARIFIDGRDTGRSTPVKLALTPGKHRVTFVIGGDRYTFPVKTVAGQTDTMTKDLQ